MLHADERGATAVEFGLICACIVIAMMSGLRTLGGAAQEMWTEIQTEMEAY